MCRNFNKSSELFSKAIQSIPGGVNSPVRALNSVDMDPIYISKGEGVYIYDEDGNKYMDFCGSWGPLILGHANSKVIAAIEGELKNGLTFGTCNKKEVIMAELLKNAIPFCDMFRMVNSGTEAVLSAVRLARGYTKKNKIIKFDGCYHGHMDHLLVSAGSGLLTNSISSSAGVTDASVKDTIVVPYNDKKALKAAFNKYKDDIAAIIIEPVAGNMGLIKPIEGFLELTRKLTKENNSLLIFDEVINGFRFHPGAYASICDIEPDLITLGKIIGGGMPIGAFGGKKEIMELLAPLGNVYQAGTLSGNPIALTAGIATLQELINNPDGYTKRIELANRVANELNTFAKENNFKLHCESYKGVFTIFFGITSAPKQLEDVKKCDMQIFTKFYKHMIHNGYYLSPSQYEVNFISSAHTEKNIESFIESVKHFIKKA